MSQNNLSAVYLELAKISKAAYAGPIRHDFHSINGVPFENSKIVHGSFGRGYCRIFWNKETTALAFRGTRESTDWWVSNFKPLPVRLRDCGEENTPRVHQGFQSTLDFTDKTTKRRSLDAVFEHLVSKDLLKKNLVITGHSMGGALALLFAVKLRHRFPYESRNNLRHIANFGSPAVGLKDFKEFYGDLADVTTRFVNGADIVPFAPPAYYRHVGREVWFGGDETVDNIGWPRRLRGVIGGRFRTSISDHHIDQYIAKIKSVSAVDAQDS